MRIFLTQITALVLLTATSALAQVQPGIDVLQSQGFAALKGKRVGLVTNQTGVNSSGVRTRVVLQHAQGVSLVALFTPEHGLDGTELAGKYVASRKDKVTGLTAYSLYGPNRKPTREMLRGIDVLVYDMQDIGCRSYTYISTMVKCMEAAGEFGIPRIPPRSRWRKGGGSHRIPAVPRRHRLRRLFAHPWRLPPPRPGHLFHRRRKGSPRLDLP